MGKKEGEFDFCYIVLRELKKINCKRRIIPFPLVFYRLGAIFHLKKEDSITLLKDIEKKGYIEIIPFKGIRLR